MKKTTTCLLSIFMVLTLNSCYKEVEMYDAGPDENLELPLLLQLNNKNCAFDFEAGELRYPISMNATQNFSPSVLFQEYADVYFNGMALKNNSVNNFGSIEIGRKYAVKIITAQTKQNLTITFTNLAVTQIIATDKITDEPKTLARIVINYPEPEKPSVVSYIGIEKRGALAQTFPKKSMGFCFLKSHYLGEKKSLGIFDMKPNTDWILNAAYVDPSRMRNKISFTVWNNLFGNNAQGIQSEFTELYVNYSHQGLYNFSEIINAQFLNLNSSHAVLYKAFGLDNQTTLFYTYSSNAPNYEIWDGWEQKYPDPRNKINWQPLAALRDAAVNKNDDEFSSIIGSIVNIDDFVDYYLFVNLIRGEDNVAKNNFLLKKSASDKLTILPWDTDFTWGYGWPATYTGYNDVISNNLFNRLVTLNAGGFKDKLKTRWFFLRNSFLNEAWLKQHFTNCYTMLYPSGIWEIENRKWNLNLKPGDEQLFVDTWITNRVAFLDQYISSL